MRLYWLVYKHNDRRHVFLQQASSMVSAQLQSRIMGNDGEYVEGHELEAKMVGKVPKKMIGRVLTADEVTELLGRLG